MSGSPAQVLIPLVRRVMPAIIANQIIGVSPLPAPGGNAFAPPIALRRWPVEPEFYRHFLRVNDRRRTQNNQDLRAAGYWSVTRIPFTGYHDCDAWCRDQFGRHAWCRFPGSATWWFSREADALLFRMVWCDPHD